MESRHDERGSETGAGVFIELGELGEFREFKEVREVIEVRD